MMHMAVMGSGGVGGDVGAPRAQSIPAAAAWAPTSAPGWLRVATKWRS
jgi:hypothetical protein